MEFQALGAAEPIAVSNGFGFPEPLGVLADPKEANAPEPRPKALDAPADGDVKLPPGVVALKEPFFIWEGVSLPLCRFEKEAFRDEESVPLRAVLDVDRESLPVLITGLVTDVCAWRARELCSLCAPSP